MADSPRWLPLVLATLASTMISGAVGMGGGTILAAVMASLLPPRVVVPLHGVVQLCSNSSRGILLWRHIEWKLLLLYLPLQIVGVVVALLVFYRGASMPWFKPFLGAFVLASILWSRLKPRHLEVPPAIFALAGLGGGLLTILVGVTGPWLSAFFLRDDLGKEQIVATKAAIQTVGHFSKIPAFLAVGFIYGEYFGLLLPMVAASIVGTWLGTRLLGRMRTREFRIAFQVVLGILGVRLVLSPWV